MNRKIFTLLAAVLMLCTTAFNADARRVAQLCVGDYVKSLPNGTAEGMYHIQADSICVPRYLVDGSPSEELVWVALTSDGSGSPYYDARNNVFSLSSNPIPGTTPRNDTVILAATEAGYVRMISAANFRDSLIEDKANLYDLQATMWCTTTVEKSKTGRTHTYMFTNKSFQLGLDWDKVGNTLLSSKEGDGWMFSDVLTNINRHREFYQLNVDGLEAGFYRVIVADFTDDGAPTPTITGLSGKLKTEDITQQQFASGKFPGMLKFSLVKVMPYVLDAKEFNTKIGNQKEGDRVELAFKSNLNVNVFKNFLVAEPSANQDAAKLTYLNVRAYTEKTGGEFLGYIGNSNQNLEDDTLKYSNRESNKHISLRTVKDDLNLTNDKDPAGFNHSYRFVYFPSEDSLVINAYYIKHDQNALFPMDNPFTDTGNYLSDNMSQTPRTYFYYGLYNDSIQDYLIVRKQDLSTAVSSVSIMTIGKHPSDIKISFGLNCKMELVGWQVSKGLYTIWDDRGYCLGVQIYNGTFTPQWIELKEGECPDRIPSYQWIIEPWENSQDRINIINREFGKLPELTNRVWMEKVLVVRGEKTQIFKNQNQFRYGPIADDLQYRGYEPINYGWVDGKFIAPAPVGTCDVTSSVSGFRPVRDEYAKNQFLGYKHFHVGKDTQDPSFGKSEDIENEKGMDYNAFAFKYKHDYDEEFGISLESRYNDTLLRVEEQATGFRFLLPEEFKNRGFEEERYGYPFDNDWDTVRLYSHDKRITAKQYEQTRIPVLKRYYYHLKVADFYEYRNGLAEQYVVLKGLGQNDNNSQREDYENMLYYGVADIYADADPFKFLRVYLRETYFLPRNKEIGEERDPVDDTRRIYYVLLDRVDAKQHQTLMDMGLEISDTLKGSDGTASYGLVSLSVDDHAKMFIKAQGRTTSARVSAFSLSNMQFELYRRLRSIEDDFGPLREGAESYPENKDVPKVLRFYRDGNREQFLYEDAYSDHSYGKGVNFLGVANTFIYPEEGSLFYNYHLYVDTAYIERGTGPIKPQYLLAVAPEIFDGETIINDGSENTDNPCKIEYSPGDTTEYEGYTYARYLVNLTDSARGPGSDGDNNKEIIDGKFVMASYYDRLAFVPALHVKDRLYILSELDKALGRANYVKEGVKFSDGKTRTVFLINKIEEAVAAGKLKERTPQDQTQLGAYYDFERWDNYHNDVTFSLRYVSKTSSNPGSDGLGGSPNENKVFYIESEGTSRTPFGGPKIAPMQGGWISIHNQVPVLSRFSYDNAIFNGEKFNVELPRYELSNGGKPTLNEQVSDVEVIAGVDQVTVLNAAKKRVTISNLMGQTIVSAELTSDNQSIPVAKGMVVVTVEGEKAIKAVIK
jgi:hypothetical protein